MGSSALSSVSGIDYIKRLDALVLALSDGSFHVIYQLSVHPTLDLSLNDFDVTSESLSTASRSAFYQVEAEATQAKHVNCINGMLSYDHAGNFLWLNE